jgi:hypothetical protein
LKQNPKSRYPTKKAYPIFWIGFLFQVKKLKS